jgi:hypothetical protein
MFVIVGTDGAMPSPGAQFTAIVSTFESRVTDVVARTAKSNEEPFETETDVDITLPSAAPADHEFCFANVAFDITWYEPVGELALSDQLKFTRGEAPHDTVGVANTSDDDGERSLCAKPGAATATTTAKATKTGAQARNTRDNRRMRFPPHPWALDASCFIGRESGQDKRPTQP